MEKGRKKSAKCQYTRSEKGGMLKKRNGGEVMEMPTYEELLAIVKMQQATIEKLTAELEMTNAK